MLFSRHRQQNEIIGALNASQAVIEFSIDGRVLNANDNFLKVMGFRREDVVGKHHEMFCDPGYVQSQEYRQFWRDLGAGIFQSDAFKRFAKGGRVVWLQATYNPIRDKRGKVTKIIKFASDITDAKLQAIDFAGKIQALDRAQAIIEFTPSGEILKANENFLKALGYRLDEIIGKHHQMFCDPAYGGSSEYQQFWKRLAAGEFIAEEFKRIGKGGRLVYIQASYNPVFDDTGTVVKVAKFATDVTEQVNRRLRNESIGREIDGDLDGVLAQMNDAGHLATSASSASTQTSGMVNAVAAASEELSASVREIAENMTTARASVEGVFKHAENANTFASSLQQSAGDMTGIVEFIQGIASQINLLALNATIESARAGDAGKGFAVVASEVKSLANQAAASTKTIGAEIEKIQTVSTEVVGALTLISGSMNQVLDNVTSVAGAIEEQHAVTGEISGNMNSAVSAVYEIEQSLDRINRAFGAVKSASVGVKKNVEELVA